MRTLFQRVLIERDIGRVFDLVSDPGCYPEFFSGLSQWRPLSDEVGLGARYRVLMRVGSIDAGGTVMVTEWEPPRTIAWEWEEGIHQFGRWRLREIEGATELSLDISFDLSGGPVGALVERLAERTLARNLRASLLAARRLLEAERP